MKDYDEKNALSIEKYSQQLIGHSFSEFCPIECKLCLNGMPVPLLRNCYSIFNGTKYR